MAAVTYEDETGYKVHKLMRCVDLNFMLGNLEEQDHVFPVNAGSTVNISIMLVGLSASFITRKSSYTTGSGTTLRR
jgi:hypothetical protein